MPVFTLASFKTGMTRLVSKAGASAQALWDMVDCKLNAGGNPVSRPATKRTGLAPAGTLGLVMFDGKRHVFASSITASYDPYVVNVIPHPSDAAATLTEIIFAEPLMGDLYVVARFSNGDVKHFWLEGGSTGGTAWQPNTVYLPGDKARPTNPNGLIYTPTRVGSPGQLWRARMAVAQGDVVEPTTFNGFRYVADEVIGDPARTGTYEPEWPTTPGATIIEDANAEQTPTTGGGGQQQPPDSTPPRYNGGSGGYGGGSSGGLQDSPNQVIQ